MHTHIQTHTHTHTHARTHPHTRKRTRKHTSLHGSHLTPEIGKVNLWLEIAVEGRSISFCSVMEKAFIRHMARCAQAHFLLQRPPVQHPRSRK
uniref:Uncharacterized protein n=1 Tax=Anguilla anguilla TaxID=7936 RepID=A0A0E9RXI2_ANGAN